MVHMSVADVDIILAAEVASGGCLCPLVNEKSSECVASSDVVLFVDGLEHYRWIGRSMT